MPTVPSWVRTCSVRRCRSFKPGRPLVGTGIERIVAKDSGVTIVAKTGRESSNTWMPPASSFG